MGAVLALSRPRAFNYSKNSTLVPGLKLTDFVIKLTFLQLVTTIVPILLGQPRIDETKEDEVGIASINDRRLILAAGEYDDNLPVRMSAVTPELLERVTADADSYAFADLVDAVLCDLHEYIYLRTADAGLTSEMIEQICLAAYERRGELGNVAGISPRAWLTRIARERLQAHYGKPYVVQASLLGEGSAWLMAGLRRLAAATQECVMLRVRLKYSAHEVASVMGTSRQTAILTGVQALRELTKAA